LPGKRIGAVVLGLVMAAMAVFAATPASAAETSGGQLTMEHVAGAAQRPMEGTVLYNANFDHMCLANHHPTVFLFGGCTGQYPDQRWYQSNGQLVNQFSGNCLAAHGDGSVFTFDCGPRYADQLWRNYQGRPSMFENVYYPGQCLAAHGDGAVFLFACNPGYQDQYWLAG
jgi:Ricin-type beta-trefoil lectin domain